jgi:dTDP-4-dehydrorhamnose reductase
MRVLLTGGSGRLGSILKEALGPAVIAPASTDFDITDVEKVSSGLLRHKPDVVVNCAAFTDVAAAELRPEPAFRLNVLGTYLLYRACLQRDVRLVQISTDHVFDGERGMYREDDRPNPIGVYAMSKYLGEMTVLQAERNAVLRTSFMKDFQLQSAFVDKYFSGDVVTVIAAELASAIAAGVTGIWHVAGPRVSIHDVAKKLKPDVGAMRLADNPVNRSGLAYLRDVSLDTSKWARFKASLANPQRPNVRSQS